MRSPASDLWVRNILFIPLFALLTLIGCPRPIGETFPSDPSIRTGALENGLTYYIKPNQVPERQLQIALVIKAGSIMEEEDERGLAHFVEHMAFNGSEHFKGNELIEFMADQGMALGPHLNAYTSLRETVYFLTFPTDKPEALEKTFVILSDWMRGLTFPPEEIEKERGVVMSEWRGSQGFFERSTRKLIPALWRDSLYSERMPIGQPEVIEQVRSEQFTQFYRKWYHPAKMAVIFVGDLDPEALEKQITEELSWNPEADVPEEPRPEIPLIPRRPEVLILQDPESPSLSVSIFYKNPIQKEKWGAVQNLRRSLLNDLIDSILRVRLEIILANQEKPPLLNTYSSFSGWRLDDVEMTYLAGDVPSGQIEPAIRLWLNTIKQITSFPPNEREFEQAKKAIMGSIDNKYQERYNTSSDFYINEMIWEFLYQRGIPDPDWYRENAPRILEQISTEDVRLAALEKLTSEDQLLYITASEEEDLPEPEELRRLYQAEIAKPAVPYTPSSKEDFQISSKPDPEPVPVLDEQYDPINEIYTWKLSNGILFFYRQTEWKEDIFELRAQRQFSLNEFRSDQDFVNSRFLWRVIEKSGIGDLSPGEKIDFLQDKVGFYHSFGPNFLSFESLGQDAELAMRMIYTQSTSPRLDRSAFEQAKQTLIEDIKSLNYPETRFYAQIREKMYPESPRYSIEFWKREVELLDFERMQILQKQFFNSPDGFTFFAAGSRPPAEIKQLVEKYLNSLKEEPFVPGSEILPVSELPRPRMESAQFDFQIGQDPKGMIEMFWYSEENTLVDWPALEVLGELVQILVTETIRELLGASYSPHFSIYQDHYPIRLVDAHLFTEGDPSRHEEILAAIKQIIQQIQQQQFDPRFFRQARETALEQLNENIQTNSFWIRGMEFAFEWGESLEGVDIEKAMPERFKAVSSDTVARLAQKFLDLDRLLIFTRKKEGQALKLK